MKMKKTIRATAFTLMLLLVAGTTIFLKPVSFNSYASSSKTVTFSESTSQYRSTTVNIPNLGNISGVTVNTGSVTYNVSGDDVTLYVSGGTPTRSVTPSKWATDYRTSSSSTFSSSIPYSDSSGYSGTLYTTGSPYVISGTYTPQDSKTVTVTVSGSTTSFPSTYDYNVDGYTGTLSQSGTYRATLIPGGSKSVTVTNPYTYYFYETWTGDGWYTASSSCYYSPSDYNHYYYNLDGYSGVLTRTSSTKTSTTYNTYPSNPYIGQLFNSQIDRYSGTYSGTVIKPDTYGSPYYQDYSGTVTKPPIDTRIWRQDYGGTVYAPTIYYYAYTVTVTYNRQPSITALTPVENQIFTQADTAFIPSITVSDADSDTLTCKCFIDAEATPRSTKTATGTLTAQTVNFDALNMGALSEGTHTVKYTAYDGTVTSEKTVSIKVDKTGPVIGTVAVTPATSALTVSGSATDSVSGLDANPYRFTIGTEVIPWTVNNSYTRSSLTPNTLYQVIFEARDACGNISQNQQNKYTLANAPVLSGGNPGESTVDLSITDANPENTQYQVISGSDYVTSTGTLSSIAQWIIPTGKTVQVNGLSPDTEYTFEAKAKNGDGTETALSSPITVKTSASLPDAPAATVTYQVDCTADKIFNMAFSAADITDFGTIEFTIIYDSSQLDVLDLCTFTKNKETNAGAVTNTSVNITQYSPGTVKFTLNKPIASGKSWSGTVNSIAFKSKIIGQSTITYKIN